MGDSRNRKQRGYGRYDKETPIPDSIINMKRNMTEFGSAMDKNVQQEGTKSTMPQSGGEVDMVRLGMARNQIMDVKLKQVSDDVSGQTVVDPSGNFFIKPNRLKNIVRKLNRQIVITVNLRRYFKGILPICSL